MIRDEIARMVDELFALAKSAYLPFEERSA